MNDAVSDEIFDRDLFFVRPADLRMGMGLKSASDSDVYDPEMQVELFQCREPDTSALTKFVRTKKNSSFNVRMSGADGPLLRVKTDPSFFTGGAGTLLFFDGKDRALGALKRKFFDFGLGSGYRFSPTGHDEALFELRTREKFQRYTIAVEGEPAAEVHLKWKGAHDTYFSTGFKQAISLLPALPRDPVTRRVVFGLALCIKRLKT